MRIRNRHIPRGWGGAAVAAALWLTGALGPVASSAAVPPWKFIVYGDTRSDDAAHRSVLNAMHSHTPDYKFIINVGDVVADGSVQAQWDVWQQACLDTLGGTGQSQVPPAYMAAPGNHDQVPGAGLANWNAYLPGQMQQFGHQGVFFTFDYANARFVVLNSDDVSSPAQTALLQQAMENNPKTWLFAIWHKPIFDFGAKAYEGGIHTAWGAPLYQHGCDLLFMGHAHYYVRTHKLDLNGQMNPPLDPVAGTAQIVTGNGGAPLYAVDENHDNNGYMVAYSFDVTQTAYYGYTELTVEDANLTLKHYRADGTVMDTASYTANPKPATATPTPTAVATATATSTPAAIPAGTEPGSAGALLEVYPNPARDRVYFRFSGQAGRLADIQIFNISGERIARVEAAVKHDPALVTWDSSGAARGVYLYRAFLDGKKIGSGKVSLGDD